MNKNVILPKKYKKSQNLYKKKNIGLSLAFGKPCSLSKLMSCGLTIFYQRLSFSLTTWMSQTHSVTHGTFNTFCHISVIRGQIWTCFMDWHLEFYKRAMAHSRFFWGGGVNLSQFRKLIFCGPCGPCFKNNCNTIDINDMINNAYVNQGNRRIAPTQNCTHEIKNVFMMLILGQIRLSKGQESLGGLVPRRVRAPRRGQKKYSTLWVQFCVGAIPIEPYLRQIEV